MLLLAAAGAWLALEPRIERFMPRSAARCVAGVTLFRLLLALHWEFSSMDAPYHVHNTWRFRENLLMSSKAPGLPKVWYPPAGYVLLSPFVTDETGWMNLPVLFIALLEGAACVGVFALMRSGGASRSAAGAGAIAAAVMPEGTWLLIKGIYPNVLGQCVALALIVALLRRARAPVVVALLALLLLTHAPAAAAALALIFVWQGGELLANRLSSREARGLLACVGAAAFVAWLVYYREAPLVSIDPTQGGWLFVRGYRVGKLLQDLVLKFGLLPLVLAAYGLRGTGGEAALGRLLRAWLASGFLLAAIAILTPFPLRFEYFLVPAVAATAGLGVERLEATRRRPWIAFAWLALFGLQVGVSTLHLYGRLEPIAVVMESPRWRFPVRF
jgi:hypothetical protein